MKYHSNFPTRGKKKLHFLHTSLAVAYEMYAKEQMKLGFKVLSESSVYRCLKGRFCVRKKIPFKDTQCANSLLVDALIVAKIRGIKRQNTDNVLNSLCPLGEKEESFSGQKDHGISRRLEWDEKNTGESEVITDHNRDCIFRHCNKCGPINMLQESIIKLNSDVDWSKQVMWHQ